MGSIGLSSAGLAAFNGTVFKRGLDLGRCVIQEDLGFYVANTTASFEQGSLVAQDANGFIVPATSEGVLGVAKWNKTNVFTSVSVDEPIAFATANSTVNLKHPAASNLVIRSAPGETGTTYAMTTDYTASLPNGTVTQVSTGAIPLATTVYATYTFQLQTSDLDFEGRNFWNMTDDVTIANSRVTVITEASVLFTSCYDTSRTYSLTGVGKNLYCGGATPALAGLFTNNAAEGKFVGHVIQLPSANDPFLGVRLVRDPTPIT